MPISTSYKTAAIRPDIVSFPGIVILAAGPIIDTAATITPGVTATRTGVGLYTLTFNDGASVQFLSIGLGEIIVNTGKNPLAPAVLAKATLQAGSTALNLEFSLLGVLTDPEVLCGFTYLLTRSNTVVL